MTDTYSTDPMDTVIDMRVAQRRRTISDVMDGVDGNPDDAADADRWSRTSGVPAPVIAMDPEGFQAQQRKTLSAQLVERNDVLRRWAEDNVMGTKVASDDWHNLDKYTQAASRVDKLRTLPGVKAYQGFMDAFHMPQASASTEEGRRLSELAGIYAPLYTSAVDVVNLTSSLFMGLLGGALEGGAALGEQAGLSKSEARRATRDVVGFIQVEAQRGRLADLPPRFFEAAREVGEATRLAKPFIAAGKDPPPGLHPITDKLMGEAARIDKLLMEEVHDTADAAKTKERSPELFEDILRSPTNIEIPPEAVRALYGDKPILPDDGLLGTVKDLEQQLGDAEFNNGRVRIPLDHWNAFVPKEVRDALKDDFAIRPEGFTPNEAKEIPPVEAPPPVVRQVDESNAGRFNDAVESLEKVLRLELKAPIEPPAVMPKARQDIYMRKINKRRQERNDAIEKQAVSDVKKERSQEWKDAAVRMLPGIETDIIDRADWQAYNWFRKGNLRGVQTSLRGRIDPEFLTPEQRALMPKEFMMKGGQHPDVAANMFGLKNGEELVNVLSDFIKQKGEMTPKKLFELQVGTELRRRLERDFGKSPEAILDEAHDFTYDSTTQMDLLHEDVISAGMMAGQKVELSVGDILKQIKDRFAQRKMKDIDFAKANGSLYRSANHLEDALLKGKWDEAYRTSQQKRNAYGLGQEINKILKEKKSFDRLLKMYGKREVENRDQQATNFIHEIMGRIEAGTRRKPGDIAREIAAFPEKDLREFVERIINDGYDVHIPEFLFDKGWAKSLDQMTTEEWRGVRDAITSLDKYSKDQKTQWVAGEERDYGEVRSHMIDKIKAVVPTDLGKYVPKAVKSYWAQSVTLEAYLNRLDQGNPLGIFNQAIVRDYATAINDADAKDKYFGRQVRDLGKRLPIKDPYKQVAQDFFYDLRTGEPIAATRMTVLAVLQNMGNPGNFKGLMDGWKVPRERAEQLIDWVKRNTTKEDWDRAQGLGNIFNEAFKNSQNMRRGLSGIGAPEIDMWTSLDNPLKAFGKEYEGWYHPIIHDLDQPQSSKKLAGPSPIEQPYWAKSTMTAANYAKQRTGYVGPYMLEMDVFQHRLSQMVRDTALRPTLTRLNKLFKDDQFKDAIKKQAGEEFSNLLEPFLKDLSGTREYADANTAVLNNVARFVIQNTIFHLVGLNPVTWGKHTLTAAFNSVNEVGATPLLKQMFTLLKRDEETGETNWQFAMGKSDVLQRRLRHYQETITANFDRTYGDLQTSGTMKDFLTDWKFAKGKIMRFRDTYHYIGAAPLAFFDQLSAVPTWLALYKKAIEAGHDEGQAVFLADRGVRRAHGSTEITNKPAFVRNNPTGALFTAFYGFFNHILMKQYETAWASRAALRGDGYFVDAPVVDHETLQMQPPELRRASPTRQNLEEQEATYRKTDAFKNGASLIPTLAGMMVAYFIIPSLVEELVQPEHKEKGWGPAKNETWFKYAGQVELRGLSGSWLGVRDIVHGFLDNAEPSAGLLGTIGRGVFNAVKDTKQVPRTTKDQFKFIKDYNSLFNIMGGVGPVPNAVARTGVFGANWYMNKERPKSFAEWWSGLVTSGTAHPRH